MELQRYDMHIAFKTATQDTLQSWTKEHGSTLEKTLDVYRARMGVFEQAPHCAQRNGCEESRFPTFTCNFFAMDQVAAQQILEKVISALRQNPTLNANFLRGRVEGQLESTLIDTDHKLIFMGDKEPAAEKIRRGELSQRLQAFPKSVSGDQYYDAHIHLLGVENQAQYVAAARLAADLGMPIISNRLKATPKPFITQRWYNSSLDQALDGLEKIYQTLQPALAALGIRMKKSPEFEVTLHDPDCQVTDRGWMSTPKEPLELTHAHCLPPIGLFPARAGRQREN